MDFVTGIIVGVVGALILAQVSGRLFTYRTFAPYETALWFRRGRLRARIRGRGAWLLRVIDRIVEVDMRERTEVVPGQEILTKDGVQVRATLLMTYAVTDPEKALLEVASFRDTVYTDLQTALRDAAARHPAEELVAARATLGAELHAATQSTAARVGVELRSVHVRDLMPPAEWKQANLQVVKARKEGQAALERARGETAALRSLANAARTIDKNPNLLHLRTLQTVQHFGESKGNTLVLGVPFPGSRAGAAAGPAEPEAPDAG